eukprot:7384847-Prymnesium_polylepis.1
MIRLYAGAVTNTGEIEEKKSHSKQHVRRTRQPQYNLPHPTLSLCHTPHAARQLYELLGEPACPSTWKPKGPPPRRPAAPPPRIPAARASAANSADACTR